nr:DUF1264 domain-containing protein [Paraburkholderia sp. BL8N3]
MAPQPGEGRAIPFVVDLYQMLHRSLRYCTYKRAIHLAPTDGKTFHNWQYDRDDFPYGAPQLMMGFTQDGQIDPLAVDARDRRLGISTEERRHKRYDISMPDVAPGANAWEAGHAVQTRIEEVEFKRRD